MTVQQLIAFLEQYDGECPVHVLQCSSDNPMTDDIGIKEVIGMNYCNGETYIVIVPN